MQYCHPAPVQRMKNCGGDVADNSIKNQLSADSFFQYHIRHHSAALAWLPGTSWLLHFSFHTLKQPRSASKLTKKSFPCKPASTKQYPFDHLVIRLLCGQSPASHNPGLLIRLIIGLSAGKVGTQDRKTNRQSLPGTSNGRESPVFDAWESTGINRKRNNTDRDEELRKAFPQRLRAIFFFRTFFPRSVGPMLNAITIHLCCCPMLINTCGSPSSGIKICIPRKLPDAKLLYKYNDCFRCGINL